MRQKSIQTRWGLVCSLLAAVALQAEPPQQPLMGPPAEFDLSWHTIDGGGVMRSTGGAFELSGTIGQFDAGRLSGGAFELTGGFWFEVVPSDCNEDGVVNVADHGGFENCFSGPSGSLLAGCACFDFDSDGKITLADFATLQDMFNAH